MKPFINAALIVVASALLLACGGSKPAQSSSKTPGSKAGVATLEPGEVKSCEDACERVAQCWQKQYGQDDTGTERRDCESRCSTKTEAEQDSYMEAIAVETSCVKLLDM